MKESELLDIQQAAAFLGVSEMSLRRWTNAGRLACFRVGGRRERRFGRADLWAFLERQPSAAASRRKAAATDAGSATGHLSGLYTSDLARVQQAVDFLADADPRRDVCFLVAAPDVRDRALALLERRRPSFRRDFERGRLVLSEYAEFAADQLEFWNGRFVAATRRGACSLRVVGDVSGGRLARGKPFEEVLQYEADYERSIAHRFPVDTLCLYDARALSGVEASGLFRHHGDAFRYPVERLLA